MLVSIPEAGLLAVLGYGIVFAGLAVLMVVVMLLGKCFTMKKAKKSAAEPAIAPVAAPVQAEIPAAPGSAGALKMHDVPPKTAAILMAIVADKMGKPLNELRFISIKEVK